MSMRSIGLLIILCPMLVQAQLKWEKRNLDKGLSIKIPEMFTPMTEEDIVQRNLSHRKPLAIFTGPDRVMDITVNYTAAPWAGDDIQLLQSFYKSSLYNLYEKLEILREDIETIDNHSFAVFEFVSTIYEDAATTQQVGRGISRYTYIQYVILKGRIYIFSFSCPARRKEEWAPIARQIMQSVKVPRNN